MREQSERQNIDVRNVAAIALGILAALILITVSLAFVFPTLIHKPGTIAAQFPAPSVLTNERSQRVALERAQQARLAGTNGGIPIEQAMQKIAERGVHAYDPVIGITP
jgi:predicted PurR-regulated permease PerM